MKFSIAATTLLAGAAAAAPSYDSKKQQQQPTCMEKGQTVKQWEVKNFDYHASYIFTTPAHQNSYGYVNFEVYNAALDYTAKCSASSSQVPEFFYGDQTYKCDIPKKYGGGDETSFKFNRATGKLELAQDWSCVKEGGKFFAKGDKKIKLECKEKEYQNKKWKIGETYSSKTVTCKKVNAKVPVKEISAIL